MKLFALRAADYFRSASREDRRYLLFNPVMKMKVTTEGEKVIDHLWDVIAAKGFEKDTYFEMAARDIRALPKLEGTVHVNIALIVKFMKNYLFAPAPFPRRAAARRRRPTTPSSGTRGRPAASAKIRFHDPAPVFAAWPPAQRGPLPRADRRLQGRSWSGPRPPRSRPRTSTSCSSSASSSRWWSTPS